MKKSSIVLLVTFASALSGCSLFDSSEAWNIAMHSKVAGRGERGASESYARDLQHELAAHHIEARVVTFRCAVNPRFGGGIAKSGVLYRNEASPRYPWWFMDNAVARPVWLPNGPVEEQLRFAKRDGSITLEGAPEEEPAQITMHLAAPKNWEQIFKRVHGTSYDRTSPADQEKMFVLKRQRGL